MSESQRSTSAHQMARLELPPDPLDDLRFVTLGNPDSRVTSLTWIGYDEFEEMWAPPAEIDQAQQTLDESGIPVEPAPVLDLADDPVEPQDGMEDTGSEQADSSIFAADPAPADEAPGQDELLDLAQFTEWIDAAQDLAGLLPRFNPAQLLPSRSPRQNAQEFAGKAEDTPQTQTPTQESDSGQIAQTTPVNPGESGDPADREAPAVTANPVKNADLGRPLAAEGLNIRTVRPTFSNVTLATARPRNPVVQIDFRQNGIPIRVIVIESSGHEQVDTDIRTALYRWRASGAALEQLPDPEDQEKPAFVSIKLQIIL